MFYNDDSLDLIEKYRKQKYQEKANGKFLTNKNNKKLPRLSLIPIILLIGYIIVMNLSGIHKKPNEAFNDRLKKEETTTTDLQKPIQTQKIEETSQQVMTKNIEIISNKPIITPPKIEPSKQETTINLMPQQTPQKQIPTQKIQEEEEIHPSTSTSIGYYR